MKVVDYYCFSLLIEPIISVVYDVVLLNFIRIKSTPCEIGRGLAGMIGGGGWGRLFWGMWKAGVENELGGNISAPPLYTL